MVRFAGTFFQSDQTWSVGFRFRSATNGDPAGIADIQTKLETWRDAIRQLHTGNVVPDTWRAAMGTGANITSIRTAAIGSDGKESAVAVVEGNPLANSNVQSVMPSQVAICISLDGAHPGAANRGRVYWPATAMHLQGDGRATRGDCQNIAADGAEFLKDLAGAGASLITPGLTPVVISNAKGLASPIVQVRVGDRFDVQRRRADKQKEGYSVAVVAQ